MPNLLNGLASLDALALLNLLVALLALHLSDQDLGLALHLGHESSLLGLVIVIIVVGRASAFRVRGLLAVGVLGASEWLLAVLLGDGFLLLLLLGVLFRVVAVERVELSGMVVGVVAITLKDRKSASNSSHLSR